MIWQTVSLGKATCSPTTHPGHYQATYKLLLKYPGVGYHRKWWSGRMIMRSRALGTTEELVKPKFVFRIIHALHLSLTMWLFSGSLSAVFSLLIRQEKSEPPCLLIKRNSRSKELQLRTEMRESCDLGDRGPIATWLCEASLTLGKKRGESSGRPQLAVPSCSPLP